MRAAACCELGARGRESARAVDRLARAAGWDDSGSVRGCASSALASIASAGHEEAVLEAIARVREDAKYPESAFLAHALDLVQLATAARSR